jgi:2-pyrone-4,6-dicarboxylate lactonase
MSQYLTPPPDPNPRKPSFTMPAGAWDCQIHLFGPAEKYTFDPESPYVSGDALPETAIEMQKALGLAKSIVVSGGGYGLDYSLMEDALRRFPDRFAGVIFPSAATTDAEFERLHRLGVRGVRFVSARRAKTSWNTPTPCWPSIPIASFWITSRACRLKRGSTSRPSGRCWSCSIPDASG